MLHGYGILLLMSPISVVLIAAILGLCAAAHCAAKACAKLPSEAMIGDRKSICFSNALISTAISIGLMLVMMIIFSFIPWFDSVFSDWGIMYEKALPQAIIYYVLWGVAYYFVLHIQKRSIMKHFNEEYRETAEEYFNYYILFAALLVFLFQVVIGLFSVFLEVL